MLAKIYIGYVIPPLPPKKIASNLAQELIEERKVGLEMFLNDILKHPVLKHCEVFEDFISLNEKIWASKVKSIMKTLNIENTNYITVEGNAKIHFTDELENKCNKIYEATRSIKDYYNEINYINCQISELFGKISKSMFR